MTNETPATETEHDEVAAAQALADLERAAMEGEAVTPTQLAEARERVTLAGLWRKGQEARAERARRKQEDEARAEAKAAVSELLSGSDGPAAAIAIATAQVFASVAALRDAAAAHNDRLAKAAAIYRSADVKQARHNQYDPLDVDGLDHDFYARFADGAQLVLVREGGRTHAVVDTVQVVREGIEAALQAQQLGRRIEIKIKD